MDSFAQKLERYAELVVKIGINLQKGQRFVIDTPISAAEFVRAVVKKAYDAGAHDVIVDWKDDEVTRTRMLMAPNEAIGEYPMWRANMYEEYAKGGAAFLQVHAANPDVLAGADPERVSRSMKAAAVARLPYLTRTRTSQISWCIASVPCAPWAAKVFPELPADEAIRELWRLVFQANRLDEPDPVAAWRTHIDRLLSQVEKLNAKNYRSLRYRGPGTELTVGLPEKHVWVAAGMKTPQGVLFIPNMPTEEVFTMPSKFGTNGTVRSTLPLNYQGSVVEDFSITFRDGKAVDCSAAKGEEVLRNWLSSDEGASYLGEVAFVAHDSPISNMRRIFYNTGYDENASCHLAIGNAYPFTLSGGTAMSKEELQANGANSSMIHIDFMIGSAELDIDGELPDGRFEPIFRRGNWS